MKTETPSVKIVAITADEAGQRIDNFLRTQLKGVVWVHHILQFLFSFKIYSTGVISASALWGLLLLYSTRYSASF
ncbi:hypothetical protein ACTTDI_19015, partial [Escherichia coli]